MVRDGYSGHTHLDHVTHAWYGTHLLRDLHFVHDADPVGRLWAKAMADTHLDAKDAAELAGSTGLDAPPAHALARRDRYFGAPAHALDQSAGPRGKLADGARKLICRFERHEDTILRFTADLTVPISNNPAERGQRPVELQQRTPGGCWRTLQGLADFAIVQTYLSAGGK